MYVSTFPDSRDDKGNEDGANGPMHEADDKNGSIKATADNGDDKDTEEHVVESERQQRQQISGEKIK